MKKKVFRNEVEKTGSRRKHRFFLSFKKKRQQKRKLFRETRFFQMTGRYVKGENKGQKKDNQVKENVQKKEMHSKRRIKKRNNGNTDVQEREQK